MREYKFRAWDKKDKEMISEKDILAFYPRSKTIEILGKKFVRCYTEYTQMHEEHESDVVLMMSTGLPDKNGNELWESDIIENEHKERYLIVWDGTGFKAALNGSKKAIYSANECWFKSCKKIGNKWDNPELLKEESA